MASVLLSFLAGLALAFIGSIASFLLVCAGLSPKLLLPAETVVPALSLFVSGFLLGRRHRTANRQGVGAWSAPGSLALIWVSAWWLVWCWLLTRLHGNAWVPWSTAQLTFSHVTAWIGVVLFIGLGYQAGRGPHFGTLLLGAALVVLLLVSLSVGGFSRDSRILGSLPVERDRLQNWARSHAQTMACERLSSGATMLCGTDQTDSTTWCLSIFDLVENPRLRLSLYDLDEHDADPGNDENYSYYGLNVFWLVPRINQMLGEGRCLVALFNGSFFDLGRMHGYKGRHVEPEVVDGRLLYRMKGVPRWTFGVSYREGRPRFEMTSNADPDSLADHFTCAVTGVQGLVKNGTRLRTAENPLQPETTIHPIPAIDALLTDRTSVGWNNDSTRLYVLIVGDPDGETASQRQKRTGRGQTGGWDIKRMQDFWLAAGVAYAVNLDGGGSTQLAYRVGDINRARYHYVTPGSLGWTFSYWRRRPVRVEAPVLPSWGGHAGVLNYFYVYEANASSP